MGLLKGQFDSSLTVSSILKQDVLDRAHPNTPLHTDKHTRTHTYDPAGVTDQSILKMTYVLVHWSKTRWHPYIPAELLVCFLPPTYLIPLYLSLSPSLLLFLLSYDQQHLWPGTPLFRHKGCVKTRQWLQSCSGAAQLLKRCCVPHWHTCLSVKKSLKKSVYSQPVSA